MSTENQLWGAPRIHGELLKLGFGVAQSNVAKCMVKRRGPSSQGWWTFLRNHAPDIAAMDLFVVQTIGFKLLYGFVIVRIEGRASLSFRFSGSVSQIHAASLVDFITNTLAFRFSVHTGVRIGALLHL
jgi:hypothetical protein